MRKLAPIPVLLIAAAMSPAAVSTSISTRSSRGTRHPYVREYKRKTFGKSAALPVVGGAAIRQMRGSPHEWGGGVGGFGKRLGSAFGTHVIKNSIQYTVAGIRHEDLHYYRSTDKRFGPRLRHALVSTVVTRKTTTGRKTAASGRVSGAVGSGLIASSWQPAGFSVASGLGSAGISLGATAGANVAREFWPRHKARNQAVK
jgi:hypothetical protein